MIVSDTQSVAQTAVRLSSVSWSSGNLGNDQVVALRPRDGKITIGTSKTVTAGSGYTLDFASAESLQLRLRRGDEVWAIAASGTVTVERLISGDITGA